MNLFNSGLAKRKKEILKYFQTVIVKTFPNNNNATHNLCFDRSDETRVVKYLQKMLVEKRWLQFRSVTFVEDRKTY